MNIYILRCGCIQVSETVPYGNAIDLKNTAKQLTVADKDRLTLPVCVYLVEHPRGLILVDTGWCREISPRGVYDPKAVREILPPHLAALFHPILPEGMAVHEQLAAMGIRPLWYDPRIERLFYRGSPLGPNRWAIDLFGDESVRLVNVPGHTDGQAAVLLQNGGRFVLLAADAAFSPRNWQEMITPGFGFSRDWQKKSLQWIAEMAVDPACAAVLCSHDPEAAARRVISI